MNEAAISRYLAPFFPGGDTKTGGQRYKCAVDALQRNLEDVEVFLVRNAKGEPFLISIDKGLLRITTFAMVGDDEWEMDNVESRWIRPSPSALVVERRKADLKHVPLLDVVMTDARIPSGSFSFDPTRDQDTEERGETLLSGLRSLVADA